MDDCRPESREKIEGQPSPTEPPLCTCAQDPFAGLPPELRPKPKPVEGGLRHIRCPGCGLEYWTNRQRDLCVTCENERKGRP
jgi:hypothetical protein